MSDDEASCAYLLMADIVAKRFLVLDRRTFFPTQVQVENIDS